jgi:hypothetical protein
MDTESKKWGFLKYIKVFLWNVYMYWVMHTMCMASQRIHACYDVSEGLKLIVQ